MKNFFGKAVFISVLWAVLFGAVDAPAETDLAVINTRDGDLRLVDRGSERVLILNKDEIYKGSEFLDVVEVYRLRSFKVVFIKDLTGPIHCPVQFFFLSFGRDGVIRMSPAFGHCNDRPVILAKKKEISVEFGAFGSMEPVSYIFDGVDLVEKK